MLLFLVLLRMTGDCWPAAFAAAVFAIHPLRVESVAWVAERKDVLCGLFFMLTLGAYCEFAGGPFSRARYVLVLVLFRVGSDGQADAGVAAARALAAGLLAARGACRGSRGGGWSGKDSAVGHGGGLRRGNDPPQDNAVRGATCSRFPRGWPMPRSARLPI